MQPVWIGTTDHIMGLNVTWGYGLFHTKNPEVLLSLFDLGKFNTVYL